MKDAEPHPIAHCKLQGAMVAVVVSLGIFLGLEKAFAHLSQEGVTILEKCVDSVGARCTCSIGDQGRRRPAIHNLKW